MNTLTAYETEALQWGRNNYQRGLKKRLRATRESRPKGSEHFYDSPFGREDWNGYIRTLRQMLSDGKF
jgi:hypothetical protein